MGDQDKQPDDKPLVKALGVVVLLTCTPVGVVVLLVVWMALMAAGILPTGTQSGGSSYDDGPSQQVYTPRGDW